MKKKILLGLAAILSVSLPISAAFAAKQIVQCNNRVNLVLFGSRSIYGEQFRSGYMTAAVPEGITQATVASRARPDEQSQPGALFSGFNYDGDNFQIEFPKEYLGRSSPEPFYASAEVTSRHAHGVPAQLKLVCMSALTVE